MSKRKYDNGRTQTIVPSSVLPSFPTSDLSPESSSQETSVLTPIRTAQLEWFVTFLEGLPGRCLLLNVSCYEVLASRGLSYDVVGELVNHLAFVRRLRFEKHPVGVNVILK